MFDALARLLRKRHQAAAPDRAEASRADASHADASKPLGADGCFGGDALLTRKPAFERNQRIAGYEFSLPGHLRSRLTEQRASARRLHDELLGRSLAAPGIATLLGRRLAFVDLAPTSIAGPLIEQLPPQNTVLMLSATPGETLDAFVLRSVLDSATARGYQVGWCVSDPGQALPDALAACPFVQIKAQAFDGLDLGDMVRRLRPHAARTPESVRLIASGLATVDDFQHCYRLGFDLFQGSFVDNRENWHPPASEIDRTHVIQILNGLRSDADAPAIAILLQQDPVLTYKFLRYINSVSMGLSTTIQSLEQGLLVLGREKFSRWLSLLMFDFKDPGCIERSLTEQALLRGRLMERLGAQSALPKSRGDELFLTGLFSLLDQIMGLPIAEILAKVQVGASARAALADRSGPYAALLQLVIASEAGDSERVAREASALGIDELTLNRELLDALSWVHEISEALT
jgi:EAL and modified HD-GYP domain-containing signal transduction protein